MHINWNTDFFIWISVEPCGKRKAKELVSSAASVKHENQALQRHFQSTEYKLLLPIKSIKRRCSIYACASAWPDLHEY